MLFIVGRYDLIEKIINSKSIIEIIKTFEEPIN